MPNKHTLIIKRGGVEHRFEFASKEIFLMTCNEVFENGGRLKQETIGSDGTCTARFECGK